jgi:hypothetical protein
MYVAILIAYTGQYYKIQRNKETVAVEGFGVVENDNSTGNKT